MIVVPCEQGSSEWVAARLGIPTASQYHRIVTPKTGKLSAGAHGYICELLAESMMGASLDPFVSEWMERGSDLEDSAIAKYEFDRDVDCTAVGFILHDTVMTGCSPDRLVGDDGGLEIKCPSPRVHVENMLGMSDKYRVQCQGTMWITGRKWWDLMSFHPDMPNAIVRVERDEDYIAKLAAAVIDLTDNLQAAKETLGIAEVATP